MKTKESAPMPPQRAPFGWIPWAIAAALAVFCGLLALDRVRLERATCRYTRGRPLDADDVSSLSRRLRLLRQMRKRRSHGNLAVKAA